MKPTKTFRYCEFCSKAWSDESPPSKAAYKSGLIKIKVAGMRVLRPRPKKGSHAFTVEGTFCNADCLVKFIEKRL